MSDYLKSYRVCIKTHSPLYIGSGLEYTKKEYVIQGGTVGIVNLQKLSVLIYKKGLFESYSDFMTGSNKDLYGWLIQNRFTKEEIDSVTDYSFSGNNVNLDKQHGIKSCIKDAFNKPYIPGSSIKGYIRTALLAYEIQVKCLALSSVTANLLIQKILYFARKSTCSLTANIGHQIYTMKQLGLTQKFGLLLLLMKQNAAIQKKLL